MSDIKKLLDEAFAFDESYKNRDKCASDLMVKTEFHFNEICKSLDVDYDKAKVLILLGHNLGWQHSAVYNHNRIAPLAKEIIVELVEALENIEPKLEQLAKALKNSNQPDERVRIAEHDACLIAIGVLNPKKALAKVEARLRGER